jgi:peptide/nickel transport system permease protein
MGENKERAEMKWGKETIRSVKMFWLEYKTQRTAVLGLAIVLITVLIAIFAPFLSPYDPWRYVGGALEPPSFDHLMGTDDLGRDGFSRIIWGSRMSMLFGVVAAVVSGIIGTILGAISGYYGGLVDDLLSRFFEIILMLPLIMLLIIVVAMYGSNIYNTILIVGITIWPWNARIMRGQVISIKERGFVLAAVGTGVGKLHILFNHIIPNGIYPVIANTTLQIGWAILTEAGLSFLGLGDPNQVTWGQMLRWGQLHIRSAWWMMTLPGIAIIILVLGFSLVGDGINYALNPKLRERTGV